MITAMQNTQPVARMQIVERKIGPLRVRWLPRGPVWFPNTTSRQKSDLIAELPHQFDRSAQWISIPETQKDARLFSTQGGVPLLTSQYVAEIDLTLSQETRLAAQHVKWRNRLRHAEKSDIDITHRPLDLRRDTPLLDLEATQRQNRQYRALPHVFTQVWRAAHPNETRLFLAKRGKDVHAYLLLLLHAPTATYHIGWTGEIGRRHSAHNALVWHAANWLAHQGYTRFDLGSVDTQNTPGLARFKIGSGANVRTLGSTLLRLPRPKFLRRYRHAAA